MRYGIKELKETPKMARYKLLAGQHIQADHSQKPTKVKDAVTGEVVERYPPKKYAVGDVFESDVDLVTRHGGDKFQLVGGEVVPPLRNAANPNEQSKFPGGQVSSGFQSDDPEQTARDVAGLSDEETHEAPPHPAKVLTPAERAARNRHSAALHRKSQAELLAEAKRKKIDLGDSTSKEDVIKAILDAD